MTRTRSFVRSAVLGLVGIGLAATALSQGGEAYVVVVNQSNTMSSVEAKELSRMFLKKVARWEDGEPILPVDLVLESAVRERFSEEVHDRTVAAVNAYWQQRVFSGRSIPPPERASSDEVIEFVRSNPGAVGYVSARTDVSGVKVLTID